mgnify:CR=1 FL=1
MIKPLLKVIPTLSGNVKLGCEVSRYEKISDNIFAGICRNGHIYPLSNEAYTKVIDVSFLNGAWEYDISKFFNNGYSSIFYKDTFKFDKNNLLYINNTASIIQDRNTDIEFGCKRVSYAKTGYQLAFFAPIYCDNVEDLPDYFEITITFNKHDLGGASKKIRVQLSDEYKYNYLNLYLTNYLKKIDDNVIYMLPESNQAVYHGIDVWLGGFNQYVDNLISKIYTEETTINGYDACISDGFRRNNLIIRQVLPLAFYFNVDDILDDREKILYKNAHLSIKGQYWKNNKEINFFMFDDNYDELSLPTLKLNSFGELEYKYLHNNLLSFSDNLALRTSDAFEYRFSNKLNKTYNRWKLKYSDDEHPYITNTNYNFSKNQNLYNLYYQYPQHYYWSSMICIIQDNEINLLLPIGDNVEQHYDNKYLVDKFELSINNYINNWFDIAKDKSLEYIINNTDWQDIHSDNKIFYKGLLYNFNNIYKTNAVEHNIDKFAILFYVNSELYDNNTANQYIHSNYALEHTSNNNVVSDFYSNNFDGSKMLLSQLYTIENDYQEPNFTVETQQYFTYNTSGEGKFVELEDLGYDFYEVNKYYRYSDVKDLLTTDQQLISVQEFIIDGYELLNISYISNIIQDKSLIINNDNIYFSYNNTNIKNQLYLLNTEIDLSNEIEFGYTFFNKDQFISYNYLKTNINTDVLTYLNEYLYYPQYLRNNNKIIYSIFKKIDNHNKFYGDHTDISHINIDNDVLYIDPYNIKDKLNNNYVLSGNVYVKDINMDEEYIVLSNICNDTDITLYTRTNKQYKNYLDFLKQTFDIDNTYVQQKKFSYTQYNVNNLISEITNISIEYNTYTQSYCYYYTDTSSIIIPGTKIITNKYNHQSEIYGYFYVSNIDNDNLCITLSNYNDEKIRLYFVDIDELNHYGYKANAINKIEGTYIHNQNGYGTYMFAYSYVFKHPTKLINKIYNLSYIEQVSGAVISDYEFSVIDYDDNINYSYYGINIVNPETDNNIYIDKIDFAGNTDNIMFARFLNLTQVKLFIKYINEYALDINNNEVSNYTDGVNWNIETDNQSLYWGNDISFVYWGSFIDIISNFIFAKETYIDTNDFSVKYKYVPLIEYGITLDNFHISQIADYIFDVNGHTFELYYKKPFIKVTKEIFDNVIRLNSDNYNDLYLYKLSEESESFKLIKFNITDNTDGYYTSSYSLSPLFDNVFFQEKTSTVLYKSYLINNINNVNFIDKTNDKTYTLYRHNKSNALCLVDVSYIYDFTYNNSYIFRPLSYISYNNYNNDSYVLPTFIYDGIKENIVTYSYNVIKSNGAIINVIDPTIKYSYFSCYSTSIPTYDKVTGVISKYLNISDSESIFDDYQLNTYTYNGVTYGFYLKEISLKNINSIFNITFDNYEPANYFTKVNNISIVNNHDYLSDVFKLLLPCMKYNVLSDLYGLSTLNIQFKTTFNKKYINYFENNINHIMFDNDRIDVISLYRYYDSIVPYIKQTSNIPTEYHIKTTQLKRLLLPDNLYKNDIENIYFFNGIRSYINDTDYITFKQLEYKYYNDNRYINLETEFDIFVSNSLSEIELLKYQEQEIILKYFEKHINTTRQDKFNSDEILFLFNKYKILILSNPVRLNTEYTNKIYTLSYKFSLR